VTFAVAIPITTNMESVVDVASNRIVVDETVPTRDRNDGTIISLDDDVHLMFSKKCPKDPVAYSLDYAICQTDGSIWCRIDTVDEDWNWRSHRYQENQKVKLEILEKMKKDSKYIKATGSKP